MSERVFHSVEEFMREFMPNALKQREEDAEVGRRIREGRAGSKHLPPEPKTPEIRPVCGGDSEQ